MIAWLGALLLLAGFVALARTFRLLRAARRVFDVIERAFATLGDDALNDDAKEAALQKHAVHALGLFGWLTGGAAAALGLPLAVIWALDGVGGLSAAAVTSVALSLPFLIVTCAGGIAAWCWWRARHPAPAVPAGAFENRYKPSDRLLHNIAFATTGIQVAVTRLEDRIFRRRIAPVAVTRPVFIAGLPRSGTTLLLELCASADEFVTHTYRRMPFVLTPLLWEKLTRRFRTDAPQMPRAHGDGMLVGPDSPEAMEEMLWLAFWPEHYTVDCIHPWRATSVVPAFPGFFRQHVRKLVVAAGANRPGRTARYISKNNLNIARVPWLLATFSDARVVIPFRTPLQHAASLLRQHRNFLEIHARDEFARRYMAALGHFDFGANLRPVDFDGWLDGAPPSATTLEFWLRYWVNTYRHLLTISSQRVLFFDFDAWCEAPGQSLAAVAAFLDVADPSKLLAGRRRVRPPRPHPVNLEELPAALLQDAVAIHDQLRARHASVLPVDRVTWLGPDDQSAPQRSLADRERQNRNHRDGHAAHPDHRVRESESSARHADLLRSAGIKRDPGTGV